MNKSSIISLVKLYAFLCRLEKHISYEVGLNYVKQLLSVSFGISTSTEFLNAFTVHYYADIPVGKDKANDEYIVLCYDVAKSINYKQRVFVFIHLLRFVKMFKVNSFLNYSGDINIFSLVMDTGKHFKIKESVIMDLSSFVLTRKAGIISKSKFIFFSQFNPSEDNRLLNIDKLQGTIMFYLMEDINIFIFNYDGEGQLYLNDKPILPGNFYFFAKSSFLRIEDSSNMYFNDLFKILLKRKTHKDLIFKIKDLSFNYKNKENGVNNLSLTAESGQFIAIMGKSGVGKSTLLKLLTGQLRPIKGDVFINGISFLKGFNNLKDIIGYMPQYDALNPGLTVFENLFFYTRLWQNNLSREDATKMVDSVLNDLEISRIRNNRVGNTNEKLISGGERRRINLAMELIRDPEILFADEPITGLSSTDAKVIIRILHEQALKGKIIFINLHQPSDEIFELFDNILILDTGGYPVIYNNPMAIIKKIDQYKKANGHYLLSKDFSSYSEYIFDTLDEKVTNEAGEYTHDRKVKPEEWYNFLSNDKKPVKNSDLQKNSNDSFYTVKNSRLKQLAIFQSREYRSKLSNKQYILLIILLPILLGLSLSILIRFPSGKDHGYIFLENPNIASFIFMSIIISLFIGMLASAEEIAGEKSLIQREFLLRKYPESYLLSKIIQLLVISAVQILLLVMVTIPVLKIKHMVPEIFFALFTLTVSANLIGLILSNLFNSLVTIYISIPFLLIPQILLSGIVIQFDEMNSILVNQKYTPVISSLLPSRWAYEAIAVEQYKNNTFEKKYFATDMEISNLSFLNYYLIPDMLGELLKKDNLNMELVNSGILYINNHYRYPANLEKIDSIENSKMILEQLYTLRGKINNNIQQLNSKKANLIRNDTSIKRSEYYNLALADLLLNVKESRPFIIKNNDYIRIFEPIYHYPNSKIGRAQLYAPVKRIGNTYINTYSYNLSIIWLINILLSMILYFSFLKKHQTIV